MNDQRKLSRRAKLNPWHRFWFWVMEEPWAQVVLIIIGCVLLLAILGVVVIAIDS